MEVLAKDFLQHVKCTFSESWYASPARARASEVESYLMLSALALQTTL